MASITRRSEGGMTPGMYNDPFQIMRELMGFDPFGGVTGRGITGGGGGMQQFIPNFDVKETKDSYVFCADLPGVREDDVDISLTGNRLTISGKRQAESRTDDERYFAYECSYGTFTRSFTLPEGIDGDQVQADLDKGVLTVTVPKAPAHQPRKISLKGGTEKLKGALGGKDTGKGINVGKNVDKQ